MPDPGLPSVSTIETYGGALANASPIEDAITDEDKTKTNILKKDASGLTRVAPRAWRTFLGHGTTPTDPGSNAHGAVWSNDNAYKPVVARTGAGVFTITWDTEVTDELGYDHTVSLTRVVSCNVEGSTLYYVQATVTSANVVTVYVFNAAGAANDAVGVTITVHVR